jgi:hypothetical protein
VNDSCDSAAGLVSVREGWAAASEAPEANRLTSLAIKMLGRMAFAQDT